MSAFIPASPQKYPYRPLVEPDSIRLLLIEPGKMQEIHCSLVHTTLYACRLELFDHYTALSYVWGDLTNPKLIWVDGIAVSVTSNLHAALCDLRDELRVFRLWVDAICINQSDLGEKGIQVAMMGNIYAAADRTVIHLSRPDNADDSVLRNLELYFRQLLVQGANSTQVESLYEQAVKSILSKPWFRRVWILQGLVLSKEPLVQYGTHRVSWDEFCRFLGAVKTQSLSTEKSACQLVTEMQDLRERFHKNRGEISMIDILLSRKGLGVTDRRDMLYAHKGLASDAGNLEVDYSKPCAGLYADMSFHGIIQHSGHGILSYVHDGPIFSRLPGLPSWCPDWSQAPSMPKLQHRSGGWTPDYVAPRLSEGSLKDKAAERVFRESHALFQHQESRVLTCLGIEVASVTHLSAPLSSKLIERTNQEYFSSRLMSLKELWGEPGLKKSEFEEAHSHLHSQLKHDFSNAREIVGSFSTSIKQHIKSLKDLYVDIYQAWQSTVSNELILPSLPSSSTWSTKKSGIPENIYGQVEKPGFLSDERIFAFGCWIFLDGEESINGEKAAFHSIYRPQYESTVDLLVQYFLPNFDKSIIDGRVLAQTALLTNSLFICPATTARDDCIYDLLPILYRDYFRHFVLRHRLNDEQWIKHNIDEINLKLGMSHERRLPLRRLWRPGRVLDAEDSAMMTCSFIGEAYGTANMYRKYYGFITSEPQEWRRLSDKRGTGDVFSPLYEGGWSISNDEYMEEEKILAIF
jgi:hypothetical protein